MAVIRLCYSIKQKKKQLKGAQTIKKGTFAPKNWRIALFLKKKQHQHNFCGNFVRSIRYIVVTEFIASKSFKIYILS